MSMSDWSSDVCSSDLHVSRCCSPRGTTRCLNRIHNTQKQTVQSSILNVNILPWDAAIHVHCNRRAVVRRQRPSVLSISNLSRQCNAASVQQSTGTASVFGAKSHSPRSPLPCFHSRPSIIFCAVLLLRFSTVMC